MNLLNIFLIISLSMLITVSICNMNNYQDYSGIQRYPKIEKVNSTKILLKFYTENDLNCLICALSNCNNFMDEQFLISYRCMCSKSVDFYTQIKNNLRKRKGTLRRILIQLDEKYKFSCIDGKCSYKEECNKELYMQLNGLVVQVQNIQSQNYVLITWNEPPKNKLCVKQYNLKLNSNHKIVNNKSFLVTMLEPNTLYKAKDPPIFKDEYYASNSPLKITQFGDTYVGLSIPRLSDLFYCVNDNILNYSIIVYRGIEVPDASPPIMPTWAESILNLSINAYQTTPYQWMPSNNQNNEIFIIGDDNCSVNDKKSYCNGPLKPNTNYMLDFKACKLSGCTHLRITTFKTLGDQSYGFDEPLRTDFDQTSKGYLGDEYFIYINAVLGIILFVIFLIAIGLYCILLHIVPRTIKNSRMPLKLRTTIKISDKPVDINFDQLLDKTIREMETEFNLLDVYLKSSYSKNVAMEPQNKSKNRYNDILPYDHNRVIMHSGDNDYINASYIQDSKSNQKYIACQGPMTNTCIDMWQMILDLNVTSIVMLCRIFENDKIKCAKYYPNNKESLDFGHIKIYNDDTIIDEDRLFTISRLRIVKENLSKTINHFQFHDWPDFETPKEHSILLGFCLEVQTKSTDGLVVVHCSAGVGRTGTFIACDILLRQIHRHVKKLNVFKTVLSLREQRSNMVQTQAQYNFIYGVLACKIKNV